MSEAVAGLLRDHLAERGWDHDRIEEVVGSFLENEAAARSGDLGAAPLPTEKGTCVYVIAEAAGCVKIGISDKPHWRAEAMQTGNSRRLTVLYSTAPFARSFALSIEQTAHAILSRRRVHREWFNCAPAVAIAAIQQALEDAQ